MAINQKICMGLFTVLIIQIVFTSVVVYFKAKKSSVLYTYLITQILLVLWLYFGMIEKMSSNIEQLLFSVRFTLIPIMLISPVFLTFSLVYSNIVKKHLKLKILLIFIPTLICIWPLFTVDYYHLIVKSKILAYSSKTEWGFLLIANQILSYVYLIFSITLILYASASKLSLMRRMIIVPSLVIPTLVSILTALNVMPSPGFDVTPVSFSIFGIVISYLILRHGFIDVTPEALQNLLSKIQIGVLLFNTENALIDYNQSSLKILEGVMDKSQMTSLEDFEKHIQKIADNKISISETENIYTLVNGYTDIRLISINYNQIFKGSDFLIGKMLIINDVTLVQKNILISERHRISSDLHDNLGNAIHVINSNLEFAVDFYENINSKECVRIAYEKSKEAFMDLRRIVNALKPMALEGQDLIAALRSLFRKLESNGVEVLFDYDEDIMAFEKFNDILYNVCLEAISNAITHGDAKQIRIHLDKTNEAVCMSICDNGRGCKAINKNNGLNNMLHRVSAVNGSLDYASGEKGGFHVNVTLPLVEEIS